MSNLVTQLRTELPRYIANEDVPHVVRGIQEAVIKSFRHDSLMGSTASTMNEATRRVEICVKLIDKLAGQHGWGLKRAISQLPRYLRYELDGVEWKPDNRVLWAPGDDF